MADLQKHKLDARAEARDVLKRSALFLQLSPEDQRTMYMDVYRSALDRVSPASEKSNGSHSMAQNVLGILGGGGINDARHMNQRIDDAGRLAGDFMDNVDFPGFVRDLLKAVFDANLEVTLEQMNTYKDLLKEASKSVSHFVNDVDDAAAFGYLAENSGGRFSIRMGRRRGDPPELTDEKGEKVDLGDNEVKAKIMEAKIAMAQEHRALLREMILMGITRLVVEKGTVKAGVIFDMSATETIDKDDMNTRQNESSSGGSASGGVNLGFLKFGGGGGGQRKRTSIRVSSASSTSDAMLQAQVTGSVEIQFKSDYFKLDNFAKMYAPQPPPQNQQGQQQPANVI